MKTIDLCEQWFRDKGYEPEYLENIGLMIKYQGFLVFVSDPSVDSYYLKVDLPFGNINFSQEVTRLRLLEAASKMNEDYKILKVYVDESNNVRFTTEILMDTTPRIDDVLPRLLDILLMAPGKLLSALYQ